jgi:hypothetical protein
VTSRSVLRVGLAGAVAAGIGAVVAPDEFFHAWLAVAIAGTAVPCGALAVLMTSQLVRGRWTRLLDPVLDAAARTLPFSALLFLPVLFGLHRLYPWSVEPIAAEMPAFKAAWLGPGFFVGRTCFYFLILSVLAWLLHVARTEEGRRRLSIVGLVVYAIAGSLAGVDWALSTEPAAHSSIYGLLFIAHQLLAGLAFALLALPRAEWRPGEAGLGGLLLSVILFWGYLHAMQYIIVWAADIPEEATWYLTRVAGAWEAVPWVLAFGQFLLPFLLLLAPSVRRSRTALVILAGLTLAMRLVESAWLTLPQAHAPLLATSCLWFASLIAWSGLWTAAFTTLREQLPNRAAPMVEAR